MPIDKAISKAKIQLMLRKDSAFISSVLLSLKVDPTMAVEKSTTTGLTISVNPNYFLNELDDSGRLYLLAHTAWHSALDHFTRSNGKKDKELKKWNRAGDLVIDNLLMKSGFDIVDPDPALGKYANEDVWSIDKIYNDLEDEEDGDDDGNGSGQPPPCGGSDLDTSGDGDGDSDGDSQDSGDSQQQGQGSLKDQLMDINMKAAMQAEMSNQAGSVPSDIKKAIKDMLNPELPWNTLLHNYFSERVKDDYSWSKRNRRFTHIYLPSMYSEGMGSIGIYVDASGSVSQGEFTKYISEMQEIKDICNPSSMEVIAFDTEIKERNVVLRDEDVEVNFTGGGGTRIGGVIDDIRDSEHEVAVIFTDGYFSDVDYSALGTDIIWVIVNNESWKCTEGHVIHMKYKGARW